MKKATLFAILVLFVLAMSPPMLLAACSHTNLDEVSLATGAMVFSPPTSNTSVIHEAISTKPAGTWSPPVFTNLCYAIADQWLNGEAIQSPPAANSAYNHIAAGTLASVGVHFNRQGKAVMKFPTSDYAGNIAATLALRG